jgi:multidrug efflux pump subunit AcrA (membrane-fusion protein)
MPVSTTESPVKVLDRRLRVTSARTWMAFLGVVLLIVAGAAWAILGRAPTEVRGRSILIAPEGLYDVANEVDGVVQKIMAQRGRVMKEGEVIASIRRGDGDVIEVKAPIEGVVVSLFLRAGTYARAGTTVATMEPPGTDLLGVVYVPAQDGKVVQRGMPVYLSPSTAPSAQYGSMVGSVFNVSELPVTSERLRFYLGDNQDLFDFLTGEGPVLEVVVELKRDESTPSGYRWTSGSGPDFTISRATLGTASIVVSEQSPASQLFG